MLISGEFTSRNEQYLTIYRETKSEINILMFSPIAISDKQNNALGLPLTKPIIDNPRRLSANNFMDYLVDGIKVMKNTNKIASINGYKVSMVAYKLLSDMETYSFNPKNVFLNDRGVYDGKVIINYNARDNFFASQYTRENGLLSRATVSDLSKSLQIDLVMQINNLPYMRYIKYEDVDYQEDNTAKNMTTFGLNMNSIRSKKDLSWYENPNNVDEKYLDYLDVSTISEFDVMWREFILDALEADKNGEVLDTSYDSESTGLNICALSVNNKDKDRITASPFAWRDKDSYLIYNDMYYFDNVSPTYMASYFGQVFKDCDIVHTSYKTLDGKRVEVSFKRSTINLIMHNGMFDIKVLRDIGIKVKCNNDTMLMSFNLNPDGHKRTLKYKYIDAITKEIKEGSQRFGHSLKNLTHRCLGMDTLELVEFLGKGNEGNFDRIPDREVARLYGCSDAYFTRLIYRYLRNLMSDSMYEAYQIQDIPMLNKLAEADYYGLRVNEANVKRLANEAIYNLSVLKHAYTKIVDAYTEMKLEESRRALDIMMGRLVDYEDEILDVKDRLSTLTEFSEEDINANDNLKNSYLVRSMYGIMEYPILSYTNKGQPAVDKVAIKKLLMKKLEIPTNNFSSDIIGANGKVLIEAKDLNKLKYPTALIIKEFKDLYKQYTSYFKPILEKNLEGLMFFGFNMGRIETRRIMSSGQTLNDTMKYEVTSYTPDHYILDFDMAQVEYRIMVSVAGQLDMVEKMKDSEKDFHTESAASLSGVEPYLVEKAFRQKMKSVHFGIPYGLGVRGMTESMYGEVNPETEHFTGELKSMFESKMTDVIDYLEEMRDNALQPHNFSKEFKDFAGYYHISEDPENFGEKVYHNVGQVKNILGFYRLFDLYNLDKSGIARIRRAAGNLPIQGTAAELFRIILNRFNARVIKEGAEDKIIWHMLIHDELVASVHKSISPWKLYKWLYEESVIYGDTEELFMGHTNYFIGIGIDYTWKGAKSDKREAPIEFVKRIVDRVNAGELGNEEWVEDPAEFVMLEMNKFFRQRVYEVVTELQPEVLEGAPVNLKKLLTTFSNYTVRAWITDPNKFKSNRNILFNKKDKHYYYTGTDIKLSEDQVFQSYFETWIMEYLGEFTEFIDVYGNKQVASDKLFDLPIIDVNMSKLVDSIKASRDKLSSMNVDEDDEDEFDLFEEDDSEEFTKFFTMSGSWDGDSGDGSVEDISEFIEKYFNSSDNSNKEVDDDSYENVKTVNGKKVTTTDFKLKNSTMYSNFNNYFDRIVVRLNNEIHLEPFKEYLKPNFTVKSSIGTCSVQVVLDGKYKTIGIYKDLNKAEIDNYLEGKVLSYKLQYNIVNDVDLTPKDVLGEDLELKNIIFRKLHNEDTPVVNIRISNVDSLHDVSELISQCDGNGFKFNILDSKDNVLDTVMFDSEYVIPSVLKAIDDEVTKLNTEFKLPEALNDMCIKLKDNPKEMVIGSVVDNVKVMLVRLPTVLEKKKLLMDLDGCFGDDILVYYMNSLGNYKELCKLSGNCASKEFLDGLSEILVDYNI